jgi:hypothetical protein
MPISIPRALVEFVLLGPTHDRRQLQDSPILGDVWLAYAAEPHKSQELLIVPHRDQPAGAVALAIDERIQRDADEGVPDIAPLHGIVAACLYFREVLRIVVPMTGWWRSPRIQEQLQIYHNEDLSAAGRSELPTEPDLATAERLNRIVSAILKLAAHWQTGFEGALDEELLPALDRYLALAGLILWAGEQEGGKLVATAEQPAALASALQQVKAKDILRLVLELLEQIQKDSETHKLVWQISLNRRAIPAMDRSIAAVKADAARTLFTVDCSNIAWAVIDAGVFGDHAAFKDAAGTSRVKKAFDFSNIRKIVSLDNLKDTPARAQRLTELLHDKLVDRPDEKEAIDLLTQLASDAKMRRPVHWDLVTRFVQIDPGSRPPASDHGTHVAGILGASKAAASKLPDEERDDFVNGMCPDIQLYDFRVLSPEIRQTEFAIIAALQYIRYLNARTDYISIHGANLSLSIPHDVRNYACGRTPICIECERLVDSGVVVVAAAGNLGYQSFTTREGSYEGYAAFSVTDPGNADGVLTVGATHRYAPHTYGVSFFSSRGPTGDGRPKPDLVAPGERIRGPFREGWGDLDGTSMAAPHVSGAAAMLMARYTELIGQPRRIKRILCESATDLGRERSFQGHGMLDVLRAFQSI